MTHIQIVGGPTTILEIGGLRLLTDPAFDAPGPHPIGNRVLTKTTPPAVSVEDIGAIDAVLLSHDQHPDNLDNAGRELLTRVPQTITTAAATERLGGNAVAVSPWSHVELKRPDGQILTVTAVPAIHGPDGTEHITGPVIGFVLSGPDLPRVYISGDNASLRVVQEVADHVGPIDIAVLHAGAARTVMLDAYLTLRAHQTVIAARILDAPAVIPVHAEGWAHYVEGPDAVVAAFEAAGLRSRLRLLRPGASATL